MKRTHGSSLRGWRDSREYRRRSAAKSRARNGENRRRRTAVSAIANNPALREGLLQFLHARVRHVLAPGEVQPRELLEFLQLLDACVRHLGFAKLQRLELFEFLNSLTPASVTWVP